MLWSILSIAVNAVYYYVMNLDIYTDRAMMPDGGIREWHRSPITRLNIAGETFYLYIWIVFAAVSVITGILPLLGVKNSILKTIRIASLIASTVLFIVIMIVTSNSHAKYV